jgi:hypothetical protein
LPSSWNRWAKVFEEAGYTALTPGWPDDPETAAAANAHRVQNQEHFVTHETREAATDPQIDGWFDDNYPYWEADDKCAWSPAPFIGTGGYSYQYEWSNAVDACVTGTPIAPSYAGTFEHDGCDTLSGWAADRNRPNTSINVSIYNNGTLLTTVLANGSRPDVGATLGDNGLHGFSIPTPVGLQDGNSHLISVWFEGSGTDLTSSPASLTCAPPPNYACTASRSPRRSASRMGPRIR